MKIKCIYFFIFLCPFNVHFYKNFIDKSAYYDQPFHVATFAIRFQSSSSEKYFFFFFKFQQNVQLNNLNTNRIYYVVVTSYFIKFPINIPHIFAVSVIVLCLLPYAIAMFDAYQYAVCWFLSKQIVANERESLILATR